MKLVLGVGAGQRDAGASEGLGGDNERGVFAADLQIEGGVADVQVVNLWCSASG
jgi:hypothetical protein